jgi:hypothetical protein
MKLVEHVGFETAVLPKDITGAAQTSDWVSLKNYSHVTIVIQQGAWAGGTPAVTLEQATAVAGTANKALAFTKLWTKVGVTGTTFVETAVVANTFNLPAVANTITVLEVDAEDLDVTGGFDCLAVLVASPGANADLLSITFILSGARYMSAVMVDAKVD